MLKRQVERDGSVGGVVWDGELKRKQGMRVGSMGRAGRQKCDTEDRCNDNKVLCKTTTL